LRDYNGDAIGLRIQASQKMPQPDLGILMYEPYLLIVATLQIYKFSQKHGTTIHRKNCNISNAAAFA
jgi:hypothetical protein